MSMNEEILNQLLVLSFLL